MTKNEALIRSVIVSVRRDIRPLSNATDVMQEILFSKRLPMDDIHVTKDIYPEVANRLNKNVKAVSKSVERLAVLCWEHGDQARLNEIIGKPCGERRDVKSLLVYFAYYTHLGVPFYKAIESMPAMLF